LISTQHTPGIITEQAAVQAKIKEDLWSALVQPVFTDDDIQPDNQTHFLVNPTGNLSSVVPRETLGSQGEIIVDTYGGYCDMGVGHFLVKTEVDRSAAYACRYVVKHSGSWRLSVKSS